MTVNQNDDQDEDQIPEWGSKLLKWGNKCKLLKTVQVTYKCSIIVSNYCFCYHHPHCHCHEVNFIIILSFKGILNLPLLYHLKVSTLVSKKNRNDPKEAFSY